MFEVDPNYQKVIREVGLDAEAVFTDPRIKVWRKLPDRENCTLDEILANGKHIRLHIKRYPTRDQEQQEFAGYKLLKDSDVPVAPIIAHGYLPNGKSFVILEDLAGYTPADKLLQQDESFETLLKTTATLAAKLHARGLHHRDLYLCHFMVKAGEASVDVKLIDTARVAKLSNPLTRGRWINKDLAQFWYSTTQQQITDEQRLQWLEHYSAERGLSASKLLPRIQRKSAAIARHDAQLNQKQPKRNISIPNAG